MQRNIKLYFDGVISNIDTILTNEFYKKEDKNNLIVVKEKIKKWYDSYIKNNTLKEIDYKDLEYISLEITVFFDKYLETESIKEISSLRFNKKIKEPIIISYRFYCEKKLYLFIF